MKSDKYISIDCSFYDNLEAFATTQKLVEINYLDENYSKKINRNIIVKDLETKNGEEFMVFEIELSKEKIKIRLDRLINIDGIEVPKNGELCILKM